MSFTGVLPLLALGLVFIGLGFVVLKRKWWAAVLPIGIGLGLILYGFSIYSNAKDLKRGQQDYFFLLKELRKNDLQQYWQENADEEANLYFVSLCSQALYRVARRAPAEQERIVPILAAFADWVIDRRKFPQWQRRNRWAEEAFFLAHAGIILGHYQELTEDETYGPKLQQIGEYLGTAMQAARYKHLISRPDDDLMRPADNAAILYALSLYDAYYATEFTLGITRKWLIYLREELETGASHLPCSAFTNTNVCRLDPTASALGMCLGYLAAAGADDNQQLYREWLHYFKSYSLSPLTLDTRSGMSAKSDPRFCDQASFPLNCEDHLDAIAMWLASEYGGHYTYARLLSEQMLSSRTQPTDRLDQVRVDKKIPALTEVAIRVIAQFE